MTEEEDVTRETADAKVLSICKQHAVFQHFPLQALIDNPVVWNVASYKHGCLIEKDNNITEWIYIVKSGEARVLKRLTPEEVDVKARRKKIMAILEQESPCRQKQKLLNFMSNQKLAVSVYNRKIYHPGTRGLSAPPGGCRPRTRTDQSVFFRSLPTSPAHKYYINRNHRNTRIFISEQEDRTEFTSTAKLPYIRTPMSHEVDQPQPFSHGRLTAADEFSNSRDSWPCREKPKRPEAAHRYEIVPPFVRVESLHPGDAFGFRSCLEPSERGPSVSLVSADCEVIRINKRFFTKQADDAVFSLIRLKAKPFPTQEECVDRLDANCRWAEYKHHVIADYVTNRKKSRR